MLLQMKLVALVAVHCKYSCLHISSLYHQDTKTQ